MREHLAIESTHFSPLGFSRGPGEQPGVVRLPADAVEMTGDARLTGSVAVLHDMVEEGWPSMDQMGHLLTTRVPALAPGLSVTPVHPGRSRTTSPVVSAGFGRLLFGGAGS